LSSWELLWRCSLHHHSHCSVGSHRPQQRVIQAMR
jgi:hypothetical protein